MRKPISIELLERYINGECTAEEIALVKEWYDSFENESDYVSHISVSEEQDIENDLYNRITADINESRLQAPKWRFSGSKLLYTAASIAAVVLIVFSLFVLQNQGVTLKNEKISTVIKQHIKIKNKTRVIYKAVLPDNSTVWLSPGAQISYPKVFDGDLRLVAMSGECFFEVSKNPEKPFVIHSNSIITKVWGTSFRVRDIDGGKSAEVSVVTGKVSVRIKEQNKNSILPSDKNEVMLYQDQKITYVANQPKLKPQKETKKSSVNIWHRVDLSFDSLPLKAIIPVLNSNYNTRITVENEELNNYILTADFAGFNLAEVLDALKKSLNINYEIKNEDIILLK